MNTTQCCALAIALTALSIPASEPAKGALIVFDNTSLEFRWFTGPNSFFLDITMPPNAQPGPSPAPLYALSYDALPRTGNSTPGQTVLSGQPDIRIARGAEFTREPATPLTRPAELAEGGLVGPTLDFVPSVALGHIKALAVDMPPTQILLPASGYVGVRFQRGGQTHFGWVHLITSTTPGIGGAQTWTFDADRWAYESEPDTPALVPGPSVLLAAGLGFLGLIRTRRRSSVDNSIEATV